MGYIKNNLKGNNIYLIPGRFHDSLEKRSHKKRDNKFLPRYRKKLTNHSFSIISNDCIGGVISHELKQQQRSPFMNLYISPSDFIKVLKDFDEYINSELIDITTEKDYCPMGKLKDVVLWFIHYKSFQDAFNCWNRRKERINKDNLFVTVFDFVNKNIPNVTHYMSMELLNEFSSLPYKIKIFSTDKRKKKSKNVVYLGKYKRTIDTFVPIDIEMFGGHRCFDYKFDYVDWLNGTID